MPVERSIGFIGGGNMAEAVIKGVIAGGFVREKILVCEPQPERRRLLAERYDVRCVEADELLSSSEIVLLAVKPQVAPVVLSGIAEKVTEKHLLVSIMAGVTTASIQNTFGRPVRVVRVMPNTPALVLQGASAVCGGSHATNEDVQLVRRMFELVGKAWLVDEKLMDAVTGLSGSGPAYVFTFIEALSDAGVKNGLPRDVAAGLAAQTVYGAAKLLLESREHPAVLRESVTSPGGTTIAALQVLERLGFRGSVMESVEAAVTRSAELGKGK
jgi:pyrroline-5-carboxylate reductase